MVVPAPGEGPGYWAGGPSAALDGDGTFWLAYRLRRPFGAGRGYANVVARSGDGVEFETVTELGREEFGCESLERPALVAARDGTWRLYVSCATPGDRPLAGRSAGRRPPVGVRGRRRPPPCSRATRPWA